MTATGTYKMVDGKFTKVSDRIPNTQVFDCFVPNKGYVSHNLGHRPVEINSRRDKRRAMAAAGLREEGTLSKKEL